MKNNAISITFLMFLFAVCTAAQTGGVFTIEKSVIASGGETSSGGSFTLLDTTGQPVAGEAQGGAITIFGGFITPPLAPTAAQVRVSGKVLTPDGRGLMNAIVTITDASGVTRSARSNTFGYYRFEDVAIGETYIFQVVSKRYLFAPQVVSVTDTIAELNFTAL